MGSQLIDTCSSAAPAALFATQLGHVLCWAFATVLMAALQLYAYDCRQPNNKPQGATQGAKASPAKLRMSKSVFPTTSRVQLLRFSTRHWH
jgi:hypothetical protein